MFQVDSMVTLPPAVKSGPFTKAETWGEAVTFAALLAVPTISAPLAVRR